MGFGQNVSKRMTRMSVAVHILTMLEIRKDERNTSDDLADGLGTNAAFVRRVTSLLRSAGLVTGVPGVGGTRLLKSVEQITLFDVFQAVQASQSKTGIADISGLGMYASPGEDKPEGIMVHGALRGILRGVERAIEDELSLATIADVVTEVRRRMASPSFRSIDAATDDVLQNLS